MKEKLKIVFLYRDEIDDKRWNTSIDNAINGNIYAYTWYLDVVAPGWGALATPDYDYLFPLPIKRKYGVNYIMQPLFCQQLGLFTSQKITPGIVDSFIDSIPQTYKYIDINLNIHNIINNFIKNSDKRKTYLLDLLDYNEHLFKKYNQNTKRNILKAIANELIVTDKLPLHEFVNIYREHGFTVRGDKDIKLIKRLAETLITQNRASIWGVANSFYQFGSVALFAESHNTIYYLFGASKHEFRNKGAMFLIIDGVIHKNSGMDKVLDFEGSEIRGIARFFEGFGAKPYTFYNYKKNVLPAGELLIRLKQKLKFI
ncbi:MAG TPA: hypothetical protein ENN49_01680 [Bacteroidales bacterium]|nr:hypothetical protein [Bacteroidales bacterium]